MGSLPLANRYEKNGRGDIILDIVIIVLLVIILAVVALYNSFMCIEVAGVSMEPTIYDGDYVIIRDKTPTYGDIVVVDAKYEADGAVKTMSIIKRVIALGGDTLYLDRGKLFMKHEGEEEFSFVEEDYLDPEYCENMSANTYPKLSSGRVDEEGFTVSEGCMFLMGDNRDLSSDSRDKFGEVPVSNVVGVVTDWSLKHVGGVTAWFSFWNKSLPQFFGIS
ncbi:MAG: signal peptidase I [Clostridia bacterium]|nr:signal peptidase I [Clostridia bacterium]